jgi:hypothetical protein
VKDRRLAIEEKEKKSKINKILFFLCDLTMHRSEVLISRMLVLLLVQEIIKERKRREYMKRELGESLKLFL